MLSDPDIFSQLARTVGLAGVSLYFLAFTLLQSGVLRGGETPYTLLNLSAASCVLTSLTVDYNPSSAAIQVLWIAVSLLTLLRIALRRRRMGREPRKL